MNAPIKRSLNDFKRRETVFIHLPSKGLSYPPGTVNFSPSGEVGVKPMTTADQITLSNPEALISGDASVKIFESCAPSIVYPEALYGPDVEAVYAAIRLATFGENTDIDLTCPECGHQHNFEMPIRYSLDNMKFLPENPKAIITVPSEDGDQTIEVFVRPYTMVESTQDANIKFRESKTAQILFANEESFEDPEKKSQFFQSIQEIARELVKLVASCVVRIVDTETGEEFDVDDKESIHEWINNLPAKEAEKITSLVNSLNTDFGIRKDIDATCEKCKHKWTTNINFDPAGFFA
ncbi:MAG: hypothetical protein M0R77_19555 [Gammaproteobacteria bacterium]|nr:hypothetical protein [Gammaproteobacteria bacterium]